METTIDVIFASGNVLQVHDLLDMVTAEAKRAGEYAVDYIKNRLGKEVSDKEKIKCVPGKNVNYVKPDFINKKDISKDLIFTFRVKEPGRRKLIQFKDNNNKAIYKRKKIHVIPSEMIELKINLKKNNINPACGQIEIEVIDRPEVLIEGE